MFPFSSYAGSKDVTKYADLVGSSPSSPKTFDFVILGGGTAGAVLASRLSEDPAVSVLLIEAGESDQRQLNSKVPAGWANLQKGPAEWDFSSVEEAELNNRRLYQPRGKMLGGCSSINAMIYQHPTVDDLAEWVEKGATGWSYADLKPYMRKAERFTPSPDYKIDESHRSQDGVWGISYPPTNEVTAAFVEAGVAAGIPHNPDLNVELNSTGITRFQAIIKNGQRSSTSAAYLPKAVYTRKNLSILTGTMATRLTFEGTRCVGAEVGQQKDGRRWTVRADKEVISCLGAFGTPQLLLVSGVGARPQLDALNIPVIKDLPGVGAYLKDHLLTSVSYKAKKGTSLQFLSNPASTLLPLAQWLWNGKGPLSTNLAEAGAFLRSDEIPGAELTNSIRKGTTNAAGSKGVDLELVNAPLFFCHSGLEKPDADWGSDFLTMAPVVLKPWSAGAITVSSDSTFDKPGISNRFLSNKRDRQVLLEGIKLIRRIARLEPLASYLGDSVQINIDTATDDELHRHISEYSDVVYHPMCTAKIGAEAAGGVVSTELKVHGLQGLRVCDASIFPEAIGAHPVATVVAIAEKFADMLKLEHKV